MLDKKYGYYVTALSKTSEPIRSNRWFANFNFAELGSGFPSADVLSLHVKEVDVPEFKSESDSFFYFGVERKVVTSVDNAGSISMTILEGEDLIGYNSILRWNQAMMNGGQFSEGSQSIDGNSFNSTNQINAGSLASSYMVNKNVLNVQAFSFASGKEVFKVAFINVKPTKIGSVKLAYEGAELYKFTVTFDFDLAILIKSGEIKVLSSNSNQFPSE